MTAPRQSHFIKKEKNHGRKCNIRGCKKPAEYEVILYGGSVHDERVFFERDFTCPFLRRAHG